MQMVVSKGEHSFKRLRGLISGMSKMGKTTSMKTFIEDNKSMVVLVCPGETGLLSLPEHESVTNYYIQLDEGEDTSDVEWSREALDVYDKYYAEIEAGKPDKLFVDGLHYLFDHMFNVITGGEWLAGRDLDSGSNPYRAAKLYDTGYRVFGQRIAGLYNSPIPFICCTVWEDWQQGRQEADAPQGIQAKRYLHPALPGKSAIKVAGRFDFRVSARLEEMCLHKNCEDANELRKHRVWQFEPRGDVEGVGINGLTITPAMAKTPWIHQTWSALQSLMKRVA